MDPKSYIPESHEPAPTPTGGPYTLTLNADELQILQLALGELLGSARRGEHLVPTIQSLLARLSSASRSA